jgi:phosphoribosylanthranilate isomerase
MPEPYVKICGITRAEDARLAVELGASALGFIFWPESPRFVEPARVRAILAAVPEMPGVGVFVDQPLDLVRSVAADAGLTAVQLHGNEPPDYARSVGLPVIKALTAGHDGDEEESAWDVDTLLLLDAFDPVLRGGTGRTVDWNRASLLAARRRVILSGGLKPSNVSQAIATIRPFAVDVSSGVEESPGRKDPEKLRAFMKAVGTVRPGPLAVAAGAVSSSEY